jgi:hypothetical protein
MANLLGNELDAESAKMLAEVAKQKGISLCGIRRDQTTADFRNKDLKPPDAILLESDLSQAAVTGALTKISLAKNELGEEGIKAICEALEQNKTLKELDISGEIFGVSNIGGSASAKHVAKMLGVNGGLTSLNLSSNQLCGLNYRGGGTYTAEGITAIANAMCINGALTALDLSSNNLEDEGLSAVCEAIQNDKETKLASLNFTDNFIGPVGANAVAAMVAVTGGLTKLSLAHNELKEEGTKAICEALEQNTTLKELDISGSNIGGSEGAKHVAKMVCVNGALTVTNLLCIELDADSAKMLAGAAKHKGISLCGIRRDQTTADFRNQGLKPPDVILLASDLSQAAVTGGLTSIDISGNQLCGNWTDWRGKHGTYTAEGITAIADALRVNGGLTSLDLSSNALCGVTRFGGTYTAEGITAIADALRVNGALTQVLAF